MLVCEMYISHVSDTQQNITIQSSLDPHKSVVHNLLLVLLVVVVVLLT